MGTAIFLDIILAAIVILLIVKGYFDGLLKAVIHLAGYFAAFLVSNILSRYLASAVGLLLRGTLIESVEKKLAQSAVGEMGGTLEHYLQSMPEILQKWFSAFGSADSQTQMVTPGQIAESVVDTAALPALTGILQVIFFFMLFIICMFVVRIFVKMAKKANRIPILGFFNRLGGALVGGLEGIVFAFVFVLLSGAILAFTANGADTIEKTFLLGRAFEFISGF